MWILYWTWYSITHHSDPLPLNEAESMRDLLLEQGVYAWVDVQVA